MKTVIVFGASGQQGSGFILALAQHNTPTTQFRILALTRDANARARDKLGHLPGVELVLMPKDYMDRPSEAFFEAEIPQGVDVVFACQGYPIGHMSEEEASGTYIGMRLPVEHHVKSLGMPYTFLRPVQFMENLLPTAAYTFKLARTVLLQYTFYTHPERKHQMISVRDIGRAGALAVMNPEKWVGRTVELAGDEYTMPELRERYEAVMGEEIAEAWYPLAAAVAWVPMLRDMRRHWDQYGYCADIGELKREMPELEDLTMFLERYRQERGL